MTVRQAKLKDLDSIFELGQEMLDRIYGEGEVKTDPQQGRKDMRYLMGSKKAIVLVDVDADGELQGFIAGQVCVQAFVNLKYVTDVAFVVRPDKPVTAVKLLRHFINWGKGQPNVREVLVNVITGLSDPEKMTTMYERLGMRHVGGSFSVWLGETAQGRKSA